MNEIKLIKYTQIKSNRIARYDSRNDWCVSPSRYRILHTIYIIGEIKNVVIHGEQYKAYPCIRVVRGALRHVNFIDDGSKFEVVQKIAVGDIIKTDNTFYAIKDISCHRQMTLTLENIVTNHTKKFNFTVWSKRKIYPQTEKFKAMILKKQEEYKKLQTVARKESKNTFMPRKVLGYQNKYVYKGDMI